MRSASRLALAAVMAGGAWAACDWGEDVYQRSGPWLRLTALGTRAAARYDEG